MAPFLIPIITGFLTALGAILLRYIENKILHDKASSVDSYLRTAKDMNSMIETNEKIQDAMDINNTIISGANKKMFNGSANR